MAHTNGALRPKTEHNEALWHSGLSEIRLFHLGIGRRKSLRISKSRPYLRLLFCPGAIRPP